MNRPSLLIAIAGLLLSFSCGPAISQTKTFMGCTAPMSIVLLINGIDNTPEDAVASWERLNKVGPQTINANKVGYAYAYNPTRNMWNDVADVLQQRWQQGLGQFLFRDIASLFLDEVANSDFLSSLPFGVGDALRQDAAAFRKDLYASWADRALRSDADLSRIVSFAKGVPINVPLVLFGHSQGSVYANQTFDLITSAGNRSTDLTAVVQAASVASEVKGNRTLRALYTTSNNDLVPPAFSTLFRYPVLQHNIVLGFGEAIDSVSADPLGHNLTGVYLRLPSLLANVVADLDAALASVQGGCVLPTIHLALTGTSSGWEVPAGPIALSDNYSVSPAMFSLTGDTGSTCGAERGIPLYSQDPRIEPQASFFESRVVTSVPTQTGYSANRRPCSSFVAITLVRDPADPDNLTRAKNRFWINATARSWRISGGFISDWEFQVRFDSGDPFTGAGYSCTVATVPNSGFLVLGWSPTMCVASIP